MQPRHMKRLEINYRMNIICTPWILRVSMTQRDTFMLIGNQKNWVIVFTKALNIGRFQEFGVGRSTTIDSGTK